MSDRKSKELQSSMHRSVSLHEHEHPHENKLNTDNFNPTSMFYDRFCCCFNYLENSSIGNL